MYRFDLSRAEYEHLQFHLTDDEQAVLNLRRKGKSRVEIAFALQISESSVKRRITSIQEKLNSMKVETDKSE